MKKTNESATAKRVRELREAGESRVKRMREAGVKTYSELRSQVDGKSKQEVRSTPDPLNWLPDGESVSLAEFASRLAGSSGREIPSVELQAHLTAMRAQGLISVVGDPREPHTMRVRKRPPVPARPGGVIPRHARPEFHSLGEAAPDLRADRIESRLSALERRVSEIEAERKD